MAEFEFDREASVAGSPAQVWELITDVPRLVGWISVVHGAREIEPLRTYSAVIQDKIGMFALRADLDIRLTEVDEANRIVAHAEGEDRQIGSRVTVDAEVALGEESENTTVRAAGNYAITGNAATLGSSSIRRKGDRVLTEFFEHLTSDASGT